MKDTTTVFMVTATTAALHERCKMLKQSEEYHEISKAFSGQTDLFVSLACIHYDH